jgi:hypothetical protein
MLTNNSKSPNLVGAAKTGMLRGRQLYTANLDLPKGKLSKSPSVPHSRLVECRRSIALGGLARGSSVTQQQFTSHARRARHTVAMRALYRRLKISGRSYGAMTLERAAKSSPAAAHFAQSAAEDQINVSVANSTSSLDRTSHDTGNLVVVTTVLQTVARQPSLVLWAAVF